MLTGRPRPDAWSGRRVLRSPMPRAGEGPFWRFDAVTTAGRVILVLALVGTIVGPIQADWNKSHIFNDRWPSHARFHGVVGLGMATLMSLFALWELWTAGATAVAAAVPIAYWGSFFLALVVPGTGVDDPPHPVPRLAGVPINVWVPIVVVVLAAIGWLLAR